MQILAISVPTEGTTREMAAPHFNDEVADTVNLYLSDIIRDFYYREDGTGVVFMMECDTVDEAQAELSKLKLVREGLLTYNCIPLVPLRPLKLLLNKPA